jgi:hypothetical protein
MRIQRSSLQVVAVVLAFLLVVQTIPLSAAELSSRAGIGSVSAIGAVDLRGVRISGDGTLFSGDRMNVGSGYARIALTGGPKLEVDSGSDVTITRDGDNLQVQMASGNVAFRGDGKGSVRLLVGRYEVAVPGTASGNVAYVGKDAFGVRVLTGSVNVRDTSTKESFSVKKGMEQLVTLSTGATSTTMASLASSVPAAVPALPQPRKPAGLSTGGWLAVIGTMAGAGAAIAVLISRNTDSAEEAAARLKKATATQTIANVTATAAAVVSTSTQVADASASASAAIAAAPVTSTFTAQEKQVLIDKANALTSKANASKGQILTLQLQLANLQDQLANASPSTVAAIESQIATVLSNVNSEVDKLNSYITDLNNLVNDARAEVPNIVPVPTIQPVEEAEGPASPTTP